eukprot:4847893-Lingulodinium_polyedra.AAC.1
MHAGRCQRDRGPHCTTTAFDHRRALGPLPNEAPHSNNVDHERWALRLARRSGRGCACCTT